MTARGNGGVASCRALVVVLAVVVGAGSWGRKEPRPVTLLLPLPLPPLRGLLLLLLLLLVVLLVPLVPPLVLCASRLFWNSTANVTNAYRSMGGTAASLT